MLHKKAGTADKATRLNTLTWNSYVYFYDKSAGDTFGIGLSNTKYVVPNKRVSAISYDIPAGTYESAIKLIS